MALKTIYYSNGSVKLVDQTALPVKLKYLTCRDVKSLWEAIKRLSIRGAPALGAAAAYGVILGCKSFKGSTRASFDKHITKVCEYIATSRPTAVNLFYALTRMKGILDKHSVSSVSQIKVLLKKEADCIYEEDRVVCRQMGQHGARLIKKGDSVLTICNTGSLATVDYGTAVGVFYAAHEAKKKFKVYACETRPLLQGARLNAWELTRAKIDTTLICDSMAASLMKEGKISAVYAGADRIASNGDTANKIGTYSLAVLAKFHKIPFYIVAPLSTFDRKINSGKGIPIEQRNKDEVIFFQKQITAPRNVKVYNPAFDVTPAKLITGIVTEAGILYPPFNKNIKKVFVRN